MYGQDLYSGSFWWCEPMMAGGSIEEEFDELDEGFESCTLSADVSEYESLSGCWSDGDIYGHGGAVSSLNYSPLVGSEVALNSRFRLPPPVTLPFFGGGHVVIPPRKTEKDLSEVELMKERFAKLLLGEDMSGGGKGVCTALAISNAITNLSATVFGELWKLEPLAPQKKLMWRREMEWLLCVSDSIVEFISSEQEFPGGEGTFEVMVTRPRSDLYINLPALKKVDAMLLSMLDDFSDSEFHYVDRGVIISGSDDCETHHLSSPSGRPSIRLEEKWWLPFPRVPPNGLSAGVTNKLQQCKEWANQILKAVMAINSSVITEMEIPAGYLDSLPKSGKACLGETIYHLITADQFSPECVLDYIDLSSEYATLEIADRIEAAIHIWKQKYLKRHTNHPKTGRSSWGGKVKGLIGYMEKKKLLARRADTILQNLKLRFPGLPQTALDMAKIQYNKDVGKSILESYSRAMESLAFNIMARIDDLLYIDDATKARAAAEPMNLFKQEGSGVTCPFSIGNNSSYPSPYTAPSSYYSAIHRSKDANPLDRNLQDEFS